MEISRYICHVTQEDLMMQRCLQLAGIGKGRVSPNPMVGCVIVADGKIIGEGYHRQFGLPHAEVEAINSVSDSELLKRSTLFVNLEPCAHYGKTPPCADLIIRSGIPEVVIGMSDPHVLVAGKGIEKLKAAGVIVRHSAIASECEFLNRRFIINHLEQRPYIILKWAESVDGFMDIERHNGEKGIHWITGEHTKRRVHQWRSEEDAVLVGAGTIRNDNPQLTVREISGRQPMRIVLDPHCSLPADRAVFNHDAKTIVINQLKDEIVSENLIYVYHENMQDDLQGMMKKLYQLKIGSVIVEGGHHTLSNFIREKLFDEVRILQGPGLIHSGCPAPSVQFQVSEKIKSGEDWITIGYCNYQL